MIILNCIVDILDSNTNIHIIFHKEDADGWCSAAIVAMEMFLEYNKQAKFYPYTYGMNLPKLKENDVVFLSGKSHQLHLLVGKDVVQISYIGVSPWGEEHTDNLETE